MKRKNVYRTVTVGIAAALSMVLAYIEFLLPPIYAALPAVKMGLANIAVVFVLYRFGKGPALTVALTAALFGSFVSLAYSAAGAILSLTVMTLLKRVKHFSHTGVSVAGGVAHNVGQIIMAVILLERAEIAYYLPVLTVTGTLAGILVGICGGIAINRVPHDKKTDEKS